MTEVSSSPGFSVELVERFLTMPEGPFLDFKREVLRLANDETKAKFIRHLIAFGNVARRTGKSCYIVFGVPEVRTSLDDLLDVRDQFASANKPAFWDVPTVSIHKKQHDGVLEVYLNLARELIEPQPPDVDIHYGIYRGKFVSYLEIKFTDTSKPFRVKRTLGNYPARTVFVRYGSSSVPLAAGEADRLFSASEIVFLKPAEWKALITHHLSGEFYRVHTLPKVDVYSTDGKSILSQSINILSKGVRSVLIVGPAGGGKSIVLQQLAFLLSEAHNIDVFSPFSDFGTPSDDLPKEEVYLSDLEVIPKNKIAVFVELRDLSTFNSRDEINFYLAKRLSEIINIRAKSLDSLIGIPESHWVFLIDGLDEIRNRETVGPIFREWMRLLPENVQVILTSRPHCVGENLCSEMLALEELNNQQIIALVRARTILSDETANALPGDNKSISERIYDEIDAVLHKTPGIYELLRRPRALDGFLDHFSKEVTYQASADRERVDVVEKGPRLFAEVDAQPVSVHQLPKVRLEDLISDFASDETIVLSPPDDETPPEKIYTNLGLIIRSVIDYLCAIEVKRQEEFGKDAKLESEKSLYAISEISWRNNWDSLKFKHTNINDHYLSWSEFVGFVQRMKYPFFAFSDVYLRSFFAASFGILEEEDRVMLSFYLNYRRKNHPLILQIYNDLRTSNGQRPLTEKRRLTWQILLALFKRTRMEANW